MVKYECGMPPTEIVYGASPTIYGLPMLFHIVLEGKSSLPEVAMVGCISTAWRYVYAIIWIVASLKIHLVGQKDLVVEFWEGFTGYIFH